MLVPILRADGVHTVHSKTQHEWFALAPRIGGRGVHFFEATSYSWEGTVRNYHKLGGG